MDPSILEDLGLTHAETKTYLSLLELGGSSAGAILEKSGLQNSVVHRALNTLIEKGLVSHILEGRRKVYQAGDPEQFHRYLEEKKRRFDEALPELRRRQALAKSPQAATIYKGTRGINEIYRTMLQGEGKEYLTFGGGRPCVELMGEPWWLNLHQKRIARKLPSRQVFDETVRGVGKRIAKLPASRVRFLSKEFAQFQETVIVGGSVAICIFTHDPYGMLIRDKAVADGYRKHFELLWSAAKA